MSSRIVYSVHSVLHWLFQAPSVNFIKKKSIELKKITYRKSPGVPELEVNTKQRTNDTVSHLRDNIAFGLLLGVFAQKYL